MFPLTRQAARHPGLEDRHSTRQSTPSIRAHDGYEWRYVLAGRLRLILGNRDVVLDVVELAEFDTQLPHWFGSTDQGPAEVVSISAGRANAIHVRATPDRDVEPGIGQRLAIN